MAGASVTLSTDRRNSPSTYSISLDFSPYTLKFGYILQLNFDSAYDISNSSTTNPKFSIYKITSDRIKMEFIAQVDYVTGIINIDNIINPVSYYILYNI